MMRSTAVLIAVLPFLASCLFQSFSPTGQLQETVNALNDETRWGRVDLASERVAPAYREAFLRSRRGWGTDVRIADTELSNLVLAPDLSSATSTIEVTWYDGRTMEVMATVLRQHWVRSDTAFVLDEETIVNGEPTLLELEEEEEAEAEGIMPSRG